MSRIRTIKPEFWTSVQVVECSPIARLLFIGMWNFADDNGVLPMSSKQIRMQVFPGDGFTAADIDAFVSELVAQGLVARFIGSDSKPYLAITGWARHQRIDRPNPKYPAPPATFETTQEQFDEHSTNIRRTFDEHSTNIRRTFDEHSPLEGKGREGRGKGREEDGKESPPAASKRARAQKGPLPADLSITPELQRWAEQRGYGDLDAHLDSFKDKAVAKGYQYADWNAALRNAIRDDWAGLRTQKPTPTPSRKSFTTPSRTPLNNSTDPRIAEVQSILAGTYRPVIEGECHATH